VPPPPNPPEILLITILAASPQRLRVLSLGHSALDRSSLLVQGLLSLGLLLGLPSRGLLSLGLLSLYCPYGLRSLLAM